MNIDPSEPLRQVRTFGGQWITPFEQEGVVGVDFGIHEDLSWFRDDPASFMRLRDLIQRDSPAGPNVHPVRSAGVKAGVIRAFLAYFQVGEVVMSPDKHGRGANWWIGRLTTDYGYQTVTEFMPWKDWPGWEIPVTPQHRRGVRWLGVLLGSQVPEIAYNTLTNWNAATTISAAGQPEVHAALVEALRRYVPDEPPGGSAVRAVQPQPTPPTPPTPPTLEIQRAELLDEWRAIRARMDGLGRLIEGLGGGA